MFGDNNQHVLDAFLEVPFKTFSRESLLPLSTKDGDLFRFYFNNGYGASVVRHSFSYGAQDGLFELAVLQETNGFGGKAMEISYDSGITNDVIASLTKREVLEYLGKIQRLSHVSLKEKNVLFDAIPE